MRTFLATRVTRAIEQPVVRVVRVLLVVLFCLMLSLSILQIALRFFFGTSILWADQAARDLVLWCGLLGSVLATQASRHFNIDVVTRYLAPCARRWFRVLAEVLAAIVCCVLVRAGIDFLIHGVDPSEEAFAGVPVSLVAIIFPASFALMALQFFFHALAEAVDVPANTCKSRN
jgi:TRAP-type C4-dicarboxylate transport system permease small subunit